MKKQIITTLLLGVTSLSFAQMSRSECIVQLNKLVTEIKLDIKTSDLDIEKAADNYNHRGKINFQEITEKTIVYQIEDFELKTKIKIEYSNIDWNHLRATRIGSSNYVDIAHSKDLGFISLDFDSNKNTIIYKEYKNNNLILKETDWDTADLFYDKKDLDEIEILINRLLEIAENAISVNLTEIKKEPALKEIRDKIFDDLRDNRVKGASTGSDIGDLSEFTTPPPNYKTDASIKTKEYDKINGTWVFSKMKLNNSTFDSSTSYKKIEKIFIDYSKIYDPEHPLEKSDALLLYGLISQFTGFKEKFSQIKNNYYIKNNFLYSKSKDGLEETNFKYRFDGENLVLVEDEADFQYELYLKKSE